MHDGDADAACAGRPPLCLHRGVTTFATDPILPPPPPGARAVLHDREYRVRAFRLAADRILIQGAIRDQKPPGLYIQHDPDPLTVHHMQLSVEISFPELEIVAVDTHFETHPREECPDITGRYDLLIGLSIARGFTHKVRELFGGPRGCTHVTALLQAMAPVALQCFWSMRSADAQEQGDDEQVLQPMRPDDESWKLIVGTCHAWAEDSEAVALRRANEVEPVPVFMRGRLRDLGLLDGNEIGGGAGSSR